MWISIQIISNHQYYHILSKTKRTPLLILIRVYFIKSYLYCMGEYTSRNVIFRDAYYSNMIITSVKAR